MAFEDLLCMGEFVLREAREFSERCSSTEDISDVSVTDATESFKVVYASSCWRVLDIRGPPCPE